MTTAAPHVTADAATGFTGWLKRAEAWLDARGKGAWIAAMVLGFIFFWPIGLALVFYITYTQRWSSTMFKGCSHRRSTRAHHGAYRSSGNTAFDAYKQDTLRRLEDEQDQFEAFLQRLRDAKDKAEFDAFMDERARGASRRRDEEAETREDA